MSYKQVANFREDFGFHSAALLGFPIFCIESLTLPTDLVRLVKLVFKRQTRNMASN